MLFIKPADLREIVTFPLFSDLVQCVDLPLYFQTPVIT